MRKRFSLMLMVIALAVMLSGCFKIEAGFEINSDGSGIVYSKSIATEDFEGNLDDEDLFGFTDNAVVEMIEEIHGEEKYTGKLQKESFSSLEELKDLFEESELVISVDQDIVTLTIKNEGSETTEEDKAVLDMIKMSSATTDFKITVPEIIETNGRIEENTAIWDFMNMDGDLFIKYKQNPIKPETTIVVIPEKIVKVSLNGEILTFPDQDPIIKEGRTLVPIRTISEALEMNVFWDNNTRTAEISKDGKFIYITIDKKEVKLIDDISTKTIQIDVPAQIINGRTMVPLRAISEIFSIQVNWNAENFVAELISEV